MPDTSSARTCRYRMRLAGLPDPDAPQPCPDCGRLVRSTRTAPLCSRCWKTSPAGREETRQRVARARAARPPAVDGRALVADALAFMHEYDDVFRSLAE